MAAFRRRTDFGLGPLAAALYFLSGLGPLVYLQTLARSPLRDKWEHVWLHLGLLAVVVVTATVFGMAASWCARRHRAAQQRRRDARAASIAEACRKGAPPGDFSLYLRAFETTGRMPFAMPVAPLGHARALEDETLDFETGLASAVEKDIPLVALGRPGEHVGAGRVPTTDESWQDDLKLLARHATLLFLIPALRAGTLWEVEWIIANGMQRKTVWLLPPSTPEGWLASLVGLTRRGGIDWKARWDPIAEELRRRGIEVPPYAGDGLAFSLGDDARIRLVTSLKGFAAGRSLAAKLNDHLIGLHRR